MAGRPLTVEEKKRFIGSMDAASFRWYLDPEYRKALQDELALHLKEKEEACEKLKEENERLKKENERLEQESEDFIATLP